MLSAALALTGLSDSELKRLIRDAQKELAARGTEHTVSGSPTEIADSQRATTQDLATRPVQGGDLAMVRALYGLTFSEVQYVTGLSFAAVWRSTSKPALVHQRLPSLAAALRVRIILTMRLFPLPWQRVAMDEIRAFFADAEGVHIDVIDADYFVRITGLTRSSTARLLHRSDQYPLVGQTANWLVFLRWYVEQYAPSQRRGVIREVMQRVQTEVAMRSAAGSESYEQAEPDARKARKRRKAAPGKDPTEPAARRKRPRGSEKTQT